jgi:hypothetical protein
MNACTEVGVGGRESGVGGVRFSHVMGCLDLESLFLIFISKRLMKIKYRMRRLWIFDTDTACEIPGGKEVR